MGWLIGQVMKFTRGKANPQMVQELLRAQLEGGESNRRVSIRNQALALQLGLVVQNVCPTGPWLNSYLIQKKE